MAATTAKPVKSAGKIPGSTLKIIAMVCMLIDHTAAVLFDRILISRGLLDAVNASDGGASFLSTGNTSCDLLRGHDYACHRTNQFSNFLFSVN